jgi:Zn finger protein HypA/HybF involved in hydrogenase expression
VLLFPLYALAVWFCAWRWRRRVWGFLSVVVGVLTLATLAMLDRRVRAWLGAGDTPFTSFQFLLWGEAAIVVIVGTFICFLPRHRSDLPCRKCGYELAGLEQHNPTCPECGLAHAAFKVRERTCQTCRQRVLIDAVRASCDKCGAHHVDVPESPASVGHAQASGLVS